MGNFWQLVAFGLRKIYQKIFDNCCLKSISDDFGTFITKPCQAKNRNFYKNLEKIRLIEFFLDIEKIRLIEFFPNLEKNSPDFQNSNFPALIKAPNN